MTDLARQDKEKMLADLQLELRRLQEEQRASSARFQAEIAVVCVKIRNLVRSSDWNPQRLRLEDRRRRVLAMLLEERSYKEIAASLGSHCQTIKNDEWRLRLKGLYPVPVKGPTDEESVRRNHVLRVWSYSSVKCEADVVKFLPDLSARQVSSDLRWLSEHGYVDRPATAETPHADTETNVDCDAGKPSEPDTERAPAPAPPAKLPKSKYRPTTVEELATAVKKLAEKSPARTVLLHTTINAGHGHSVLLDSDGNGTTMLSDHTEHQHLVSRFCVMSKNKHAHDVLLPP